MTDKRNKDGVDDFEEPIQDDPAKIKINPDIKQNIQGIWSFLKDTMSFKEGADIDATIRNIREGINFKGPNVWVLICSIVVASVGLNVNSTAVIIGAMLISPLMGPIRGIGLGVGTNDLTLIIDSLKNFGIAVGISLLTAWIYFFISPISELTPELEARTGPNLMDVFIAFFGGLAGIIAASRGDNSTVIPGVAIATALMPPLCTAGYGLAIGNIQYFLGASYLFLLNTLFICLSTIVVVRYMKFPLRRFLDPKVERKVTYISYFLLFLVVIPAVVLFYGKVQETVFKENARKFMTEVILIDETIRAEHAFTYNGDNSHIEIFLKNKVVSEDIIYSWERQMKSYGLKSNYLTVIQGEDLDKKLASIKRDLEQGSGALGYDLMNKKQDKIIALEKELDSLRANVILQQKREFNIRPLRKALALHFPEIDTFEVYSGLISSPIGSEIDSVFAIGVKYKPYVRSREIKKINEKLKQQFIIFLDEREIYNNKTVRVYNHQ